MMNTNNRMRTIHSRLRGTPPILFALLALCLSAAMSGAAWAQETTDPSLESEFTSAAKFTSAAQQTTVHDSVEELRQEFQQQELLSLRRMEGVETRMEMLDRNINRVFLIFGLSALLILMLVLGHQRSRNRLSEERVTRALRDAETLSDDIRRELTRPEMEFLRIGYFLRRLMRQFIEHGPSISSITQIRSIAADPHVPVSLHCMAQVLMAEYEKRWGGAIAFLEQLRVLDPEDPFVLLHLSHMHTRIAKESGDARDKKRHLQTANQYYSQFAVSARLQDIPLQDRPHPGAPPAISASPPEHSDPGQGIHANPVPAPQSEIIPPKRKGKSKRVPPSKVTEQLPIGVALSPAGSTPSAHSAASLSASSIPANAPQTAAQTAAAPATSTTAPVPSKPSKPQQTIPRAEPSAEIQQAQQRATRSSKVPSPPPIANPNPNLDRNTGNAKPQAANAGNGVNANVASANGAGAATSQPPQQVVNGQPQTNGATASVASAALQGVSQTVGNARASISDPNNWRKVGSAIASGSTGMFSEIRNAANKLRGNEDPASLPLLPVPAVSELPEKTETPAEMEMWREIRQGDLRTVQASEIFNIRRRIDLIDRALTHYAQAQGHKTNQVLYHNWGLSLLGKALHLPEKKRDPYFNAAVDKFLAGNVIAPHQFDFPLASLYAIIGHNAECKKWLAASRASGTLNIEELLYGPDFDKVRQQPWFAQFISETPASATESVANK